MNTLLNTPQFSLRWNNYVSHVTGAFNLLREDNDLVDVTLCCEGKKIKAHKMLLSACSAYFKEIFKENPCQHPVVIFRNVKFDDLNAIINFMYHGEVSILQEQLESFLITAELLEVKGLTDSTEEYEDNESKSKSFGGNSNTVDPGTIKINENIPYKVEEPINLAIQNPSNSQSIPTQSTSEMRVDSLDDIHFDTTNVEESKISNQMDPDEDMQIENQTTQTDIVDKNNSTESDLAKFRCQLCPKGFKHPTSLTLHKDSHAGKTQCPVCHRSFSRSYDMRSHLQKIHQGKQLTIKEIRYRTSTDVPVSKNYTHNM